MYLIKESRFLQMIVYEGLRLHYLENNFSFVKCLFYL
jgi:hypothetical protein